MTIAVLPWGLLGSGVLGCALFGGAKLAAGDGDGGNVDFRSEGDSDAVSSYNLRQSVVVAGMSNDKGFVDLDSADDVGGIGNDGDDGEVGDEGAVTNFSGEAAVVDEVGQIGPLMAFSHSDDIEIFLSRPEIDLALAGPGSDVERVSRKPLKVRITCSVNPFVAILGILHIRSILKVVSETFDDPFFEDIEYP